MPFHWPWEKKDKPPDMTPAAIVDKPPDAVVTGDGVTVVHPPAPKIVLDWSNSQWELLVLDNGKAGLYCKESKDWMVIASVAALKALPSSEVITDAVGHTGG